MIFFFHYWSYHLISPPVTYHSRSRIVCIQIPCDELTKVFRVSPLDHHMIKLHTNFCSWFHKLLPCYYKRDWSQTTNLFFHISNKLFRKLTLEEFYNFYDRNYKNCKSDSDAVLIPSDCSKSKCICDEWNLKY